MKVLVNIRAPTKQITIGMKKPLVKAIDHARDEWSCAFAKRDTRASPSGDLVMNMVSSALTATACLQLTYGRNYARDFPDQTSIRQIEGALWFML